MSRPSETYVSLCQRFARWLTEERVACPGDWLAPDRGDASELRLVLEPVPVPNDAVVVPCLERLLDELRRECASFVLDYTSGEFACVAFDDHGRMLANVVASDPAAAAAQALVFIRAERAAQSDAKT